MRLRRESKYAQLPDVKTPFVVVMFVHWPCNLVICWKSLFYGKKNLLYIDVILTSIPSLLSMFCYIVFASISNWALSGKHYFDLSKHAPKFQAFMVTQSKMLLTQNHLNSVCPFSFHLVWMVECVMILFKKFFSNLKRSFQIECYS